LAIGTMQEALTMPRPPIRDPRKDPRALLGRALKRLRVAAGYTTQAALAARLDGHGEDSVQKAETGYQLPTDDLILRWLDTCDASVLDRELIADLAEHAREAEPIIPHFAEPWLEVEREATLIRIWALFVMPGLLQTLAYARAMFTMVGLNEDQAAAKATRRVKRRDIVGPPSSTRLTALLYEPLLNRLVGTPEIMIEELDHLLEMSQLPNVVLQVIPEAEYFVGCEGQFEIASGRGIPDTLNMITVEDQTVITPALVDKAIATFEEVRGYALNVTESRALIQEALQRWKTQQL
jgi:Domain of unknown function (DUF5753)